MSQINTLIKPTHQCNMRCKYCFSEKYGYDNLILDITSLKKYLFLLSQKFQHVNIVWHGGEPLLAPLDFYAEIYDYCSKMNSKFTYSLQTNGTLLNRENISFFKKHNTHIGLSFDGISNEFSRGNTQKILSNIELLKSNNIFPGAILVVNQSNVDYLIDEYEYFKKLNIGMKINPMFSDGAAKTNDFLNLDLDQYIKNFISFFKYWASDKKCNIQVSNCLDFVNLVIYRHIGLCTNNSCLGKWLCLDSNGHIYPCDRLCQDDYDLGSVDKLEKIDEIFCTPQFIGLLKNSIERRKKCISECDYFLCCYGGCNANAILAQEGGKNNACYIQKGILMGIYDYIFMINGQKENDKMNPSLKKILRK